MGAAGALGADIEVGDVVGRVNVLLSNLVASGRIKLGDIRAETGDATLTNLSAGAGASEREGLSERKAGTAPLARTDDSTTSGLNRWIQIGDISAGGDVNFGLTSEQVWELTEAAARGATEPLATIIVDLSKRLGITQDTTKTLLRIVGEQDVPLDRLSETPNRIANDYKRLQDQAAALRPNDATARDIVAQAEVAIVSGQFAQARHLLREAKQVQLATALTAGKLAFASGTARRCQRAGSLSQGSTVGSYPDPSSSHDLQSPGWILTARAGQRRALLQASRRAA
jgi:hypothetical protein